MPLWGSGRIPERKTKGIFSKALAHRFIEAMLKPKNKVTVEEAGSLWLKTRSIKGQPAVRVDTTKERKVLLKGSESLQDEMENGDGGEQTHQWW